MNELRRMQYLEVMGIDTYVPRYYLVSARRSAACSLPAESVAGDESVVQSLPEPRVETPAACEPSSSASAQPAPAIEAIEVDVPELPKTEKPEQALAFTLALWTLPNLQIVDSRQKGEALPTEKLLNNILQSAALLPTSLPKVELMHWPMVENASDKGWRAARQMTSSFIEGRLAQQSVALFLLFGEEAYRAVLATEDDFSEACFKRFPLEEFQATALVLPKMSDILYRAEIKPRVWRALLAQ